MTESLHRRPFGPELEARRFIRHAGAQAGTTCCLLLASALAGAQAWAPNETLVSAQKDLLDPEYNQARAQFTWGDADGKLWLGNIDRDTGLFYPPDGKAILVDPDAMKTSDVTKTGNGPEWVWAAGGDAIVYTKFAGAHSQANVRLGYAHPLPDGSWAAGFLGPDTARKAPYGSETLGDPNPRITYVDENNVHHWREIADAGTEQLLPGTPDSVVPVRHVRGARAVIYPRAVDGVNQVTYRDLDTGQVQQLTFDAGDKDPSFMWRAPEFGNEFLFLTLVDHTELRVYRNLPPQGSSTPHWTPIYSALAPQRFSIVSPEPFTHNGRSYVHMAMTLPQNNFSSEVWISNIDAANPIFRRITDNSLLRARGDPEVFVTNRGPLIYYNRREVTLSPRGTYKFCGGVKCSEGVYMADPGLGP
jgi:hypothetical protein